ncbi:MAG: NADH-dependent [FeFe] hydrogenase, group A6 [Bacilli bacterium]|jgi:NADH-quinone oxidoreductase subunit G/NADP-reducing hydrogenase subunit HndD
MPHIKINNVEMDVPSGITILEAAHLHNIDLPTLCHYPDLDVKNDCRVCVVEIEGQKGLVTSCSTPVREGMNIKTHSTRVLNARKIIVEMILANHDSNCPACARNMNCELQKLARSLNIETNRFPSSLDPKPLDDGNECLVRNPNRCIKCGRCVDVCRTVQNIAVLEVMGRGHEVMVSPAYGNHLNEVFCSYCGQCAAVCPVGAIIEKDDTGIVWDALHDPDKHVVVQVAPAIRVSLGEELGLPVGSIVTGQVVAALKMLGFDRVFDTNFTADMTIIEEGHEFINRMKNGGPLPLITSCCPGWIRFAEHEFPEILSHISSCKSPQQMFGAIIKSYYAERAKIDPKNLYVVSIMPCTAKKYEAKRPEMATAETDHDVDAVLTTRELGKMIKQMGIDFRELQKAPFDDPCQTTSGAAAIFGVTGGVMEAALRTVKEVLDARPLEEINFVGMRGINGIKEAEVEIQGHCYKVAVAHTLGNARKVAQQVKDGTSPYAFIEVMACPGGCIGGGGQPYGTTKAKRARRSESIYEIDEKSIIRKSHENPMIQAIYRDFLIEPCGHKSHELLHTKYTNRKNG